MPARRLVNIYFRYVFHCHILEHEDNDMMQPYDVIGSQAGQESMQRPPIDRRGQVIPTN